MQRRVLNAFIVLCLMMTTIISLPVSAKTGTNPQYTEGIYRYRIKDEGAAIGYIDRDVVGDVTIPSELGGYPVTAIEGWAMDSCQSLTSITIPESVKLIGDSALSSCRNLKSVIILGNDTIIGEEAFKYCESLTNLILSEGVKIIENNAFERCKALLSIKIPDSVTTIGEKAFYRCESLSNITVGNEITKIGQDAFTVTAYSSNYDNWEDGILYIGECLISASSKEDGKYVIRDGTRCIADYAFSGISAYASPSSISMPDSLVAIGDYAFEYCKKLTTVTIPDSVKIIGKGPFVNCESLKSINVDADNEYFSSVDGNLFNKEKTTLTQYCAGKTNTSYIIPSGVTTIGAYAFSYCYILTSVTIPDGVTTIGEYAFNWCTRLSGMTIPDSVTTIGESAFYYCSGMVNVKMSDGVTTIGKSAFEYCKGITSITIPDGVTVIEDNVFKNCEGLKSVTLGNGITNIGNYGFYQCKNLTSVKIPDNVKSILMYAFSGCERLRRLILPHSLGEISKYAFEECVNLYDVFYCGSQEEWENIKIYEGNSYLKYSSSHCGYDNLCLDNIYVYEVKNNKATIVNCDLVVSGNIVIPSRIGGYPVEAIGKDSFEGLDDLTVITIPEGVVTIENNAFYACRGLSNICIPSSVTSICEDSFKYCTSLNNFSVDELNNSYSSIDGNLFNKEKTALITYAAGKSDYSYTIPDGVKTIGNYAFVGCNSIGNVTIPDCVQSIGDYAFNYCEGLESIKIGNDVKSIGEYAFEDCTSLSSVIMGSSVESIGRCAFYDCDALTSITIPDSVTTLAEGAFGSCNSLSDIKLGDGITSIGYGVFDATSYIYNDDNWTDGVLYIGDYLIDADVSVVGKYAVRNGTRVIADNGFESCYELTEVDIPESVITIGNYVFRDCYLLNNVNVNDNNKNYCSEDGVLFDKERTRIIRYGCGRTDYSYTIPDGVKTIDYDAFGASGYLMSITIPDTITHINNNAFSGCSYLTSVYYAGSQDELSDVVIANGNEILTEAAIYYNQTTKPKITSIVADNGVVTFEVINMPDDIIAYIGVYNEYGVLTEIKEATIIENKAEASVDMSSAETIKAFVWKANSTQPICREKQLDI